MRIRPRIWVISELYYPEETSTGFYMTKIAEYLGEDCRVGVICGRPNYSAKGERASRRELRNGVDILRCPSTLFNKDRFFPRLINIATFGLSVLFYELAYIRRKDDVIVVTNPPLLPLITPWVCRLKGARCTIRIDDVYPDVLSITGLLSERSLLFSVLRKMTVAALHRAFRLVVLGRDMAERVQSLPGFHKAAIVRIIPHWAEEEIHPQAKDDNALLRHLNWTDKFVVLYAGNMGRPHDIDTLAEVIDRLQGDQKIRFLLIGSGYKLERLKKRIGACHYTHAVVLAPRPRSEQEIFLNACDIVVSALIPGMAGISVPSRMYNVFSAGKPILAIGDREAELNRIVEEECVGWSVEPGHVDEIIGILVKGCAERETIEKFGWNARRLAETQYSAARILSLYRDLLAE